MFKDPPPKEDCLICFLPMPVKLICFVSLPDATVSSVPICNFADANEDIATLDTEEYNPCCGCGGCFHSIRKSENNHKCLFCNSDRERKTDEEMVEEIMKRVEANDATSICLLANSYQHGINGFQQDLQSQWNYS